MDAFYSAVEARALGQLRCRPGCAACCQQDLTVVPLEALAVLEGLEGLDASARRGLGERAATAGPPCVFLVDGRCAVYAHRPLVCRSHGLPILERDEDGERVSCCELNFAGEDLPAETVLDGTRLSTTLGLADTLLRRDLGLAEEGGGRIALRALAAAGWEALPESVRGALVGERCAPPPDEG